MVPYLDAVLDVFERHDSIADLLITGGGLTWGEDVFKDLHHTLSKRSDEIVENEVWI